MQTTELVFNLWYIMEQRDHLVYAVAGKVYALAGADREKTGVLKLLASTDYLTVQFYPVLERFHVVAPNGKVAGVTTPAALNTYIDAIYDEVFAAIEIALPESMDIVHKDPLTNHMQMPEEPLFVLTALIDDGKGVLHAAV